MTNLPSLALIATLSIATGFLRPPFQSTFVTRGLSPGGAVLADPTRLPFFVLWPENSVARQTRIGEVMQCEVSSEPAETTMSGDRVVLSVVHLDCHGARFTIRGVQFRTRGDE